MIYKILETKQATQQWIYEVEADNAEDAIAMVIDGDVECIDYIMDTDEFQEDGNIEVIDTYEKTPVTQQLQ
jgi:hypothetical protein